MTTTLRRTLMSGAIAVLIAAPAWAATDTDELKTQSGQPAAEHPAIEKSTDSQRAGDKSQAATTTTPSGAKAIYSRSADDLDGMEVVDRTGDKIGKVKQIVLAPDRKSAHAIIAEGGVVGIGAREVMVSLDQLTPMGDDKLQVSTDKKQFETLTTVPSEQYVALEGDAPISGSIVEFSAFEPEGDTGKAAPAPMAPNADHPAVTPQKPSTPQ